jgi:hypothetical protein
MKRKSVSLAVLLCVVLAASLILGATANWGRDQRVYVGYKFQAVLDNPVVTTSLNPPFLIVDGYRPASGIQSCNVTINNKTYFYPDDFSYQETFHVEANQMTGKGIMQVTTTLIFDLPGHPVLTEYLTTSFTRTGPNTVTDESQFYLTGTRMLGGIEGGGFAESYGISGTDYALHIGLVKGWPF